MPSHQQAFPLLGCCVSFDNFYALSSPGKTFIAAELIKMSIKRERGKHPNVQGRAALFLVPTCLLVAQQANAVREWAPTLRVSEYMGASAEPVQEFDVLVATPASFLAKQAQVSLFEWSRFALVIFDEGNHFREIFCNTLLYKLFI